MHINAVELTETNLQQEVPLHTLVGSVHVKQIVVSVKL
jgi:hypothetical protein